MKKILLGVLVSCLIAGLTIPAMAGDVAEKKGDMKLVGYAMAEDPVEEGDALRFGGFGEVNLSQRIRIRLEFADFEKEGDRLTSMVSGLYAFYPKKNFSPHLGAGVKLGTEKPDYFQVVLGFIYKPWNVFAEAKFLIEDVGKASEVDIEESKLLFCVGLKL